jgi:hypothetical protein
MQECIRCIGIYHCYVSVGLQLRKHQHRMPARACRNSTSCRTVVPPNSQQSCRSSSPAFSQPARSRAACRLSAIDPVINRSLRSCPPRVAPPLHPSQRPSCVRTTTRLAQTARRSPKFLIADRTLPPSPHPVCTPVRARGSWALRVGWAGGPFPLPCFFFLHVFPAHFVLVGTPFTFERENACPDSVAGRAVVAALGVHDDFNSLN